MADWNALARAAGCSQRTLERWRRAGAPEPAAGEAVEAWAARVRAWAAARPKRGNARRVVEAGPKPGTDWEEQSRRALALNRLHDLAVKRGEFMPKARVVEEWARRCLAFRMRFLAVPRQLAARCANAPADVVEREAAALVREALMEFLRRGDLTPTPAELEELPQ